MRRLYDPQVCREVTDKYPEDCDFDVEEWFSNPENYSLIEGRNIGFAEPKGDGVYWIHLCFDSARGREAVDLAQKMIDQLYRDTCFKSVVGLVRAANKKARWAFRKTELKPSGFVEINDEPFEMFISTRMPQ